MSVAKRVAIYARVSTRDQSTEIQLVEIQAYLKVRGWEHFTVYEDKATGTNTNRPMLKLLQEDARAGKLDLVVCWKLDRFARSLPDLIRMLQELSELGIEFISIKDQLDLTTSVGKLMLHIIGAFANFEADLIKERVCAGIANAKAKGQRLGRPRLIDPAKVSDLHGQGWSLGKIARHLGVSKAGVHKSLSEMKVTKPFNKAETVRDTKLSLKL